MTAWSDRVLFTLVAIWVWVRHPLLAAAYLRRGLRHGRLPAVAVPRSADDKFFWRKVFDHDPRFTLLSDKLGCKAWVAERTSALRVAPVLWQGRDPAQIPDEVLTGDVVFKANHGCGTNQFIHAGDVCRHTLTALGRRWLRRAHGRRDHQWGYFNIERTLFIESMIVPASGPLQELKFYVFAGRIRRLVHIADRFGGIRASVWERSDVDYVRAERTAEVAGQVLDIPLPAVVGLASELASRLAAPFDHLRVDLLTDGQQLWLGELTVYNLGGYISGDGHDPDAPVSRHWDLRRSAFLQQPPQRGWRARYAKALLRALPPIS
ncbi:MAG: ATP-grasp fold amidoligase family protein [Alcanivoracaceae bacterium]